MAMSNLLSSHFVSAQALTASFNSAAIDTRWLSKLAIQIIVTACTANNGQFSVESSIDGANWDTITLNPVIPVLASANTTISVELPELCTPYVRVKFVEGVVKTDGTANIWLAGKEV